MRCIRKRAWLLLILGTGWFGMLPTASLASVVVSSSQDAGFEEHGRDLAPDLVWIPGGRFVMGSPETEEGRKAERETQHEVSLGRFALSKYPVTRLEFAHFVAATGYRTDAERYLGEDGACIASGSHAEMPEYRANHWLAPGFRQDDRHPVVCVSWNDARVYTAWLSAQTGQHFRLPTEAEWEYAARAGTRGARYWGDDPAQACSHANVADRVFAWPDSDPDIHAVDDTVHDCNDGHEFTAPVGSYDPNPWGLYDVLGNVWEWTCSGWSESNVASRLACETHSRRRVARGGGWADGPARVRSAERGWVHSGQVNGNDVGFRLLLQPAGEEVAEAAVESPAVYATPACERLDRARERLAATGGATEANASTGIPARLEQLVQAMEDCLCSTTRADGALILRVLKAWAVADGYEKSRALSGNPKDWPGVPGQAIAETVVPYLFGQAGSIHAALWILRVSDRLESRQAERIWEQWSRAEAEFLDAALWIDVAASEPRPARGSLHRDSMRDGGAGPELVFVRGGRFLMGSPAIEAGRASDERQHRVDVEDFWLGRYAVTVGEFRRFVEVSGYRTDAERDAHELSGCWVWQDGKAKYLRGRSWRDPGFAQQDNHPVVCVSWHDAHAYAQWLSEQTGQEYRMPTEAEWEYAARAGTMTPRYWGSDPAQACRYANVGDRVMKARVPGVDWSVHECDDGYAYTAPVGSFAPNAWGLFDMLGNVLEWTCSAFDMGYGGAEQRCSASSERRGLHALRGGSWTDEPDYVRSAFRSWSAPGNRSLDQGFRLARSP